MLDEEKVKLMAEIAIYEKKQRQELRRAGNFFKDDYIRGHMFKSFLIYNMGFLCLIGIIFMYQAEAILANMDLDGIDTTLIIWILGYLVGLLLYFLLIHRLYKKRYEKAARVLRLYIAKLKRLERRYEFQDKTKELAKGEQNHDEPAHV